MSSPRLPGSGNRNALHASLSHWLHQQQTGDLPPMSEIARRLPVPADGYLVANSMKTLAHRGEIDLRHGTNSQHRGHYAIRVRGTGVVLKTNGCPFDPPNLTRAAKEAAA